MSVEPSVKWLARKTCPSATFSATNPTWLDRISNSGRRGMSQRLSAACVSRFKTARDPDFRTLRSNTIESLHRSPPSRKRRRIGNPVPGGIWATLFLGDINTGTWPSRFGESQELGQWNMVLSLAWLRWRGPAATENCRPCLSSERVLQNNKPATVSKAIWRRN
jgi:hypothetical protein